MDTIPNRICSVCKKEFPATPEYFNRKQAGKFGLSSKCKVCDYKRKVDWNRKNPERAHAISKKAYRKIKDKNPNFQKEYVLARRIKLKKLVFDAYGGKCACCGETNFEFLSVDHINGDGHSHRDECNRKSSYRTINMYKSIIEKGFPKDIQVLCFNCHFAKDFYGYCPHGNIKREYER